MSSCKPTDPFARLIASAAAGHPAAEPEFTRQAAGTDINRALEDEKAQITGG